LTIAADGDCNSREFHSDGERSVGTMADVALQHGKAKKLFFFSMLHLAPTISRVFKASSTTSFVFA
jgi:hypothetical protein